MSGSDSEAPSTNVHVSSPESSSENASDKNPDPDPRPQTSGDSTPDRDEQIGEGSVTTAELVTTNEIREFATEEPTNVASALRYCKRRILYPYLRLLGVMGLKSSLSPHPESSSDNGTCFLILNKFYFILVVLLLLAGYILQYSTCFRRDRGFVYKQELIAGKADKKQDVLKTICDGNPLLIHALPSICHLSSFLYMVYLYRFKDDDESLQNLIERVFIQATQAHFFSQKKLLRTLQTLVLYSVLWLMISTACQLVQIWTHHISFNFDLMENLHVGLVGTLALSTTWQDAIQVTVIISYCIHCILLSSYLELLVLRIQQHTISLGEFCKEIGEIEKLTKHLNGKLSTGLGPLLLIDSATAVSSIGFLALKGLGHVSLWDFVSNVLVATLWLLLFIFPLIQAATLSSACKKVREIGHFVRLRPFGYQDTPREDLDSFLLFVSTLQMDVRIVKIPISASILSCTFALIAFFTLFWGLFLSSAIKAMSS